MCRQLRSDVDLMVDLLQDDRERQVVAMRYGLADGRCMTFKEIGEALPEPVSGNLARTIFMRAMGRLRELSTLLQPSTAFA
jgi:DNA-directed RNA polymerase sigma subunit (sigma70/sigma32)